MAPPAGTASSGSGGAAAPPRRTRSASRCAQAPICSRDGGDASGAMKEPLGILTPGNCSDVAHPSLMSQLTKYGSWNRSRRKPAPGGSGPAVGLRDDVDVLDLQQVSPA